MKKTDKDTKNHPIDWDDLATQVFLLKLKKISPEAKLAEAKRIAAIYRKARKPLPNYIAALV